MLRALPSIQKPPSSLPCGACRPGRDTNAAGTAGTDLVGGGFSRRSFRPFASGQVSSPFICAQGGNQGEPRDGMKAARDGRQACRGAWSKRLASQPLGRTFPDVTAFCISPVNIWEKSHVSAH